MSEQNKVSPLLTTEAQLTLNRISQRETPYSQRAQALLALNEGKTDEEASAFSGLRPTQVRYWFRRYGKTGLAIFPADLLAAEGETPSEGEREKDELVVETAVTELSDQVPPAKKEKKRTKKEESKAKTKKIGKKKKTKKESKGKKKSNKPGKDKNKKIKEGKSSKRKKEDKGNSKKKK